MGFRKKVVIPAVPSPSLTLGEYFIGLRTETKATWVSLIFGVETALFVSGGKCMRKSRSLRVICIPRLCRFVLQPRGFALLVFLSLL